MNMQTPFKPDSNLKPSVSSPAVQLHRCSLLKMIVFFNVFRVNSCDGMVDFVDKTHTGVRRCSVKNRNKKRAQRHFLNQLKYI